MDILALLDQKGIEYVSKGHNEISIECVNKAQHQGGVDNNFSLNLNTELLVANCLSCGCRFNTVGLTKWLMGEALDEFQLASLEIKGKLKKLESLDLQLGFNYASDANIILPPGQPWDEDYRNIPKELYRELEAARCSRGRFSDRIILPIRINGKLRGFESRTLVNAEPKYLRNTGFNAKSMGVYPYDYVKAMKPKSICLVEGVFDCLNLLSHNYPAICIFGTHTFSLEKMNLLLSLGIEEIIMFFDKDHAGLVAQDEISEILKPWIRVSHADQSKVKPNVEMTLAKGRMYWQDAADLCKDELDYCIYNRREFR